MCRSIRTKLIITYLIVILASMLVTGVYLTNIIEGYYLKRLSSELNSNALLIRELVRGGLMSGEGTASLDPLADDLGRNLHARVTIIARDGKVLGDSDGDPAHMENHIDRPEIQEALSKGVGTATRHSTTLLRDMKYVAVPVIGEGERAGELLGFVRVAVPLTEVTGALRQMRKAILHASLLSLFLAFLLGSSLTRGITRSLREMKEIAHKMASGDFRTRIHIRGGDELAELSETFNHMADQLQATIAEISDRKNKMEAILKDMADAVIASDEKGRIILFNPAAERMFGVEEREVAGSYVLEAVRSHELDGLIKRSLTTGSAQMEELHLYSPAEKFLRAHTTPLRDGRGGVGGVVTVVQDITELRKLERVRAEFVSNASHELRTPVTAIKGFVDTLLDDPSQDPETVRKFLDIIGKQTDRLARLIKDLLDLTKIESRRSEISKRPVNIREVAEESVSMLAPQARAKAITVELAIPEDFPQVPADPDMLSEVFMNLLDNAIKYTPDGGRVTVGGEASEAFVTIWVKDTGIGIPAQHLSRVFERFYRVDKARSRELGGTGLGLAIVKHIVERHGGSVSVESEVGRGSTFVFTLPRSQEAV